VEYRLDDETPDFALVQVDLAAFHAKGRRLHGKLYREQSLGGPLTLSLGAQLLATLRPALLPERFLGPIKGMMSLRNKCEFEHGLCPQPLNAGDVEKNIRMVSEVLAAGLGIAPDDLEARLAPYHFPQF
jgi:hypothetical protein